VASMIDTVIMRRSTAALDSPLSATAPTEFIPLADALQDLLV